MAVGWLWLHFPDIGRLVFKMMTQTGLNMLDSTLRLFRHQISKHARRY